MFSVPRFLKVFQRVKPDFFKMKINYFGAKAKDPSSDGVDKTKRSVSGGAATASDSEKREPGQQTIKVAKTSQSNQSSAQSSNPTTAQSSNTSASQQNSSEQNTPSNNTTDPKTQSNEGPNVLVINTVPGNRVRIFSF